MLFQALRQAKYRCLVTGKGTARLVQNQFQCQLLCITLQFFTVFNFLVPNVIFVRNWNFYISLRFCNVSVLFSCYFPLCHLSSQKRIYVIYNTLKIVFIFYYFPVTFQFIIASQYHKCKRSDTNRSMFKMFLLCLAECLLTKFHCQVLQTYISGNLQSYTYKPTIFKVIYLFKFLLQVMQNVTI